jgi:hypothetical protein
MISIAFSVMTPHGSAQDFAGLNSIFKVKSMPSKKPAAAGSKQA